MTVRIIPCLDTAGGKVVKGTQFLNLKELGDPLELALEYQIQGADELVLLDISSPEENQARLDLVKRMADQLTIPLLVGGGLRSLKDIAEIFAQGAQRVSLGSAAVKNPALVEKAARCWGEEKIVVAVDAFPLGNQHWEVYIGGGRQAAGLDVLTWVRRLANLGAGEILLTGIRHDGTRDGYDLTLTKMVSESISIPVIASGGVGKLEHFWEGAVLGKAQGLLAASVFHYGLLSIQDVKKYLWERYVPVCLRK